MKSAVDRGAPEQRCDRIEVSYQIGDLTLSQSDLCSQNGHVEIDNLPMLVLRLLIRRAGHVVSKDEIISRCWRDEASDDALYSAMRKLRTALGTHGKYIRTHRNRGYSYIGPVTQCVQTESSPEHHHAVTSEQ